MKLSIIGMLVISFVFHLIPQFVVLGVVWALNEFAGTSIAYWIPAAIIFAIWILLVGGYSFVVYGMSKKITKKKITKEQEEFDRKFESMRNRRL